MSRLMAVRHGGPLANPYPVCQNGPLQPLLGSSEFFVRLLNALAFDFAESAVLYALLVRQADLGLVAVSARKLSLLLGSCVSDRHVNRVLESLEDDGLLESRAHPNTATAYQVRVPVLLDLLAAPLSEADVIPGLTPVPALTRIFAAGEQQETLHQTNVGHFGELANGYPVRQNGPPILTSSAFFVRLLNALAFDFPKSAVLYALLVRDTDLDFVQASQRDLSSTLGGCVSMRHANRALRALEDDGLLESRTHPNTATAYQVRVPALLDLLAAPLSEAEVKPGLTPFSALTRMAVCSSTRPTLDEGNHDAPICVR